MRCSPRSPAGSVCRSRSREENWRLLFELHRGPQARYCCSPERAEGSWMLERLMAAIRNAAVLVGGAAALVLVIIPFIGLLFVIPALGQATPNQGIGTMDLERFNAIAKACAAIVTCVAIIGG